MVLTSGTLLTTGALLTKGTLLTAGTLLTTGTLFTTGALLTSGSILEFEMVELDAKVVLPLQPLKNVHSVHSVSDIRLFVVKLYIPVILGPTSGGWRRVAGYRICDIWHIFYNNVK